MRLIKTRRGIVDRFGSGTNRKGDISMETIVVIIIALAVLLVIIGIFTFQTKKGSGKINDISDSTSSSITEGMCMGSITYNKKSYDLKCKSSCDEDKDTYLSDGKTLKYGSPDSATFSKRKCMMPEQVCCGYPVNS